MNHQEQESWYITIMKREKHMLLMDQMDGKLEEHCDNTYNSNVTQQAPNPKELQTKLTSSLTILTFPKPPQ